MGMNCLLKAQIIEAMNSIRNIMPLVLFFFIKTIILAPEKMNNKIIINNIANTAINNTQTMTLANSENIALKIVPITLSAI
jgi:hypothetical protein